jgi:hypothetical protein
VTKRNQINEHFKKSGGHQAVKMKTYWGQEKVGRNSILGASAGVGDGKSWGEKGGRETQIQKKVRGSEKWI